MRRTTRSVLCIAAALAFAVVASGSAALAVEADTGGPGVTAPVCHSTR